ncbi:MAG TPA: ABC transporter ATP-binding protein [Clostridiales bacterium]|nr:ABC transporter ATP-binding protein [Clostridiales bacterium]
MLVIENLVKQYGKFKAVDNLSMEIKEEQIYGFVGANGAGKTTTMKIIAGLLKATSGKVALGGVDIEANPGRVKSRIGYMPDFFGVYDDLKVSEYMDFYAGVYGIAKSKRKELSDQLIELVNLQDKTDVYVDTLSRGMKQRLCLARSLIHDPELLILDEPASGLDPGSRVEMKEILKELRKMGKTVLISSHILSELSEMCTSIGIIDRGKMVASGPVADIIKKASYNRVIRIKVTGSPEMAVKFLKEQPSVGSISEASDYIDADFNGNEQELASILRGMIYANISVISFMELEKNLESAFMSIIRKNGGNSEKIGNGENCESLGNYENNENYEKQIKGGADYDYKKSGN